MIYDIWYMIYDIWYDMVSLKNAPDPKAGRIVAARKKHLEDPAHLRRPKKHHVRNGFKSHKHHVYHVYSGLDRDFATLWIFSTKTRQKVQQEEEHRLQYKYCRRKLNEQKKSSWDKWGAPQGSPSELLSSTNFRFGSIWSELLVGKCRQRKLQAWPQAKVGCKHKLV